MTSGTCNHRRRGRCRALRSGAQCAGGAGRAAPEGGPSRPGPPALPNPRKFKPSEFAIGIGLPDSPLRPKGPRPCARPARSRAPGPCRAAQALGQVCMVGVDCRRGCRAAVCSSRLWSWGEEGHRALHSLPTLLLAAPVYSLHTSSSLATGGKAGGGPGLERPVRLTRCAVAAVRGLAPNSTFNSFKSSPVPPCPPPPEKGSRSGEVGCSGATCAASAGRASRTGGGSWRTGADHV